MRLLLLVLITVSFALSCNKSSVVEKQASTTTKTTVADQKSTDNQNSKVDDRKFVKETSLENEENAKTEDLTQEKQEEQPSIADQELINMGTQVGQALCNCLKNTPESSQDCLKVAKTANREISKTYGSALHAVWSRAFEAARYSC